jgi:protease-4
MVKETPKKNRWVIAVVVLLVLGLFSLFAAGIVGLFVSTSDFYETGNVAVIKIRGMITIDDNGGFASPTTAGSSEIVELIEEAAADELVDAIVLDINSGGGSPVASYEIVEAVLSANKTTVAWVREVGASGAYWIASATDYIVVNPMSITGSIGVIGSYLDFSEFISDHNVSYQRLVSGDYKDMGIPFKELSSEEEAIIQANLDLVRDEFVRSVALNREMNESAISEVANGLYYLGMQAYDLGLVDKLGGKAEVVKYIEDKEDIEVDMYELAPEETFLDALTSVMSSYSFSLGLGIGESGIRT